MIWSYGPKTYIKYNDDYCVCLNSGRKYKTITSYKILKDYPSDKPSPVILGVTELTQWTE